MLFIHHCASVSNAQTPEKKEEKKEEYRIKIVKVENGKTITVDTVFTSHADLEKFHKENMVKWHQENPGHDNFSFDVHTQKEEKEIIIKGKDSTVKHQIRVIKIQGDSGMDVTEITHDGGDVLKILETENLSGLDNGDIKVVKIYAFVKIDIQDPTKDELKNTKNAEINNAAKDKGLILNDLNIYPNPASSKLNMDFELTEKGPVEVLLTDLQGKEVHRENFVNAEGGLVHRELDIKNLQSGYYLLKIKSGDKSLVKKLVVE